MSIRNKEFYDLSPEVQSIVKNHMRESAKYFDKLKNVSDDVRNLLINHHEKPGGDGFPRGLDSNHVTPLEALFILSVNFCHVLIESQLNFDKVKLWLEEEEKIWSKGNYKRSYQIILKLLNQNLNKVPNQNSNQNSSQNSAP